VAGVGVSDVSATAKFADVETSITLTPLTDPFDCTLAALNLYGLTERREMKRFQVHW